MQFKDETEMNDEPYADDCDALQRMVRNGRKGIKELAAHLWPYMNQSSGYARVAACLNPEKDKKFALDELASAMKFCGRYDPLYYLCDATLHARPERRAPRDEEVQIVETIKDATNVLKMALSQLENMRQQTREEDYAKDSPRIARYR